MGNFPVVDSVAWAQLDSQGKVVSEGVYWPAIPAKALADARRLEAALAQESGRKQFLSHVLAALPAGKVVIRHSSAAMLKGPFEVLASHDVLERRASREEESSVDGPAAPVAEPCRVLARAGLLLLRRRHLASPLRGLDEDRGPGNARGVCVRH